MSHGVGISFTIHDELSVAYQPIWRISMRKAITIILAIMLISVNSWSEEDSYLEGISILGNKKVAYLSVAGHKIAVKEGEEIVVSEDVAVGRWQVVSIGRGSIRLKAKIGITTELRLDSRSPIQKKSDEESPEENELGEETPEEIPITDNETTPQESEVQPEHKIVRTPFGSFTVKKNVSLLPPIAAKSPPVADKIPLGHRLVRTPFGYFIVKDSELTDN